ncbi:MAG: L,D-transpeptidase family protein, partial [Mucilaginibacter sp.]
MRARLKKILRIVIITLPVIMIAYYFYPEEKFPHDVTIDRIEIYKSQSRLLVYSKGQLIKTYKVSIGGNPAGQKEFEGDRKTPEGI